MSAQARRTARAEAAHAAATAPTPPARWLCRVQGCPSDGVEQPAPSYDAAVAESHRHYMSRHYNPEPPPDLEEQRAAWIAAGRPPLGA